MEQILLNHGVLGVIVLALALFVLRIMKDHKSERDEWRNDTAEREKKSLDTTSKIDTRYAELVQKNTDVLSGLKALLETSINRNK